MKTNHAIVIRSKNKEVYLKKGKLLSTAKFSEAHYFNSTAKALTFLRNQPKEYQENNEVVKIIF